jgi:hypothetical protein
MLNLTKYLADHVDWSKKTFGEGNNITGLCNHITKELEEIKQSPGDVIEYADVFILLLDLLWRNNHTAAEFIEALQQKQQINFQRKWHIENFQTGKPVEHVKMYNPRYGNI